MPQAMNYKANSVIYFRGDASKKIYILQSGRIILKRDDMETGQEVQETIQTGEFFGVKSALGKYIRDEDAIVVSDSQVLMFLVPEFEALVMQNTRVGMKMLKVFSNQLRRLHAKVKSLMALDENRSPEDGMFHSAEYYLKKKKYTEAIYILRKYEKYFPSSTKMSDVKRYLNLAESYAQKYGSGNGPAIIEDRAQGSRNPGAARANPNAAPKKEAVGEEPGEKEYYDAVSLMSQEDFKSAFQAFKVISDKYTGSETGRKASFEMGRCLFGLKQYEIAIKHMGALIKEFPEMPEMADTLYVVGQSYDKSGEKTKAASVYERILQIGKLEEDVRRKVKLAQKALGG